MPVLCGTGRATRPMVTVRAHNKIKHNPAKVVLFDFSGTWRWHAPEVGVINVAILGVYVNLEVPYETDLQFNHNILHTIYI